MKVPRFVTAFPPISIDYSPRIFQAGEINLRIYKGKFDVDVPIGVAAERSGGLELHGILSFQGCNENQCLPPKKQEFTLSFDVLRNFIRED